MRQTFLAATGLALAAGVALAGMARADAPVLQRVPGTVAAVSGDAVDVSTPSGVIHTVMTADTKIAVVSHARPSDLKAGEFIGSAAARQPDGSYKALEVHVFPASMRGTGQGNYPWDEGAQVTMTNGAVAVLKGTHGRTMTIDYGNGSKDIFVPTSVPIVNIGPGDRSQLVKGKQVLVIGVPAAGGAPLPATYVILGSQGVKPPM